MLASNPSFDSEINDIEASDPNEDKTLAENLHQDILREFSNCREKGQDCDEITDVINERLSFHLNKHDDNKKKRIVNFLSRYFHPDKINNKRRNRSQSFTYVVNKFTNSSDIQTIINSYIIKKDSPSMDSFDDFFHQVRTLFAILPGFYLFEQAAYKIKDYPSPINYFLGFLLLLSRILGTLVKFIPPVIMGILKIPSALIVYILDYANYLGKQDSSYLSINHPTSHNELGKIKKINILFGVFPRNALLAFFTMLGDPLLYKTSNSGLDLSNLSIVERTLKIIELGLGYLLCRIPIYFILTSYALAYGLLDHLLAISIAALDMLSWYASLTIALLFTFPALPIFIYNQVKEMLHPYYPLSSVFSTFLISASMTAFAFTLFGPLPLLLSLTALLSFSLTSYDLVMNINLKSWTGYSLAAVAVLSAAACCTLVTMGLIPFVGLTLPFNYQLVVAATLGLVGTSVFTNYIPRLILEITSYFSQLPAQDEPENNSFVEVEPELRITIRPSLKDICSLLNIAPIFRSSSDNSAPAQESPRGNHSTNASSGDANYSSLFRQASPDLDRAEADSDNDLKENLVKLG